MALNQWGMLTLTVLVLGIAGFDLKTRRIPNRVNFLLFAAGLISNFPGAWTTWCATVALVLAWLSGWIGGGDAKFWIALLWFVSPVLSSQALVVMGTVFLTTGFLQLAWRRITGRPIAGIRSPGAWRAIPFAFWLLAVA